jgi:plasmid stability protein
MTEMVAGLAMLLVKSVLVLTAACLIVAGLRRQSAAARHAVWSGALVATLALPAFSVILPPLRVPLLPDAPAPEVVVPQLDPATLVDARVPAQERAQDSARSAMFAMRSAAPPPLPLVRYAGRFEHPVFGPVIIAATPGGLTLQLGDGETADLEYHGGDTFFTRWRDPFYQEFRGAHVSLPAHNGSVDTLRTLIGRDEFMAVRRNSSSLAEPALDWRSSSPADGAGRGVRAAVRGWPFTFRFRMPADEVTPASGMRWPLVPLDPFLRVTRALTCFTHVMHVRSMAKMIQIRNVPEPLHRTLTVRAAQAGMSLSDYLLMELRHVAERPTLEELRARIAARERADPGESAATAIRAERDAREAQLRSSASRPVRPTRARSGSGQ